MVTDILIHLGKHFNIYGQIIFMGKLIFYNIWATDILIIFMGNSYFIIFMDN